VSDDHRAPAAAPADPASWLSLGPASRLLGVDPDTLRRWADSGRVPSWTTPGGHRRFDRRTIARLTRDRGGPRPPRALADLGASPARLTRVYQRRYAAVGSPEGPAEREAYRQEGRRLIAALVAYLDADVADAGAREAAEAAAAAIVDGHGQRAAAAGTSLTEAVGRFVGARQPFLAEIAGLGRRRSLDPAHLAALVDDASVLLDRLLLRFIAAYQAAAPEPGGSWT
jgi:excisionase family DNA binding protein